MIEASHFDAGKAYAAVDRHRLDDIDPYIYRTPISARHGTRINNGIPEGAYVRAVREDPRQERAALCRHRAGRFLLHQ